MMLMTIIMTPMMECGKFPPDTPTYIAQGGTDPSSLTTSSSIKVQRCTVRHNLNEGVTLCGGGEWSHKGSFRVHV